MELQLLESNVNIYNDKVLHIDSKYFASGIIKDLLSLALSKTNLSFFTPVVPILFVITDS